MSGWIKLEKSLETDPRVLRAARALAGAGNAPALHGVTLLVGALARLWILADSHARKDDSLDMGFSEIDDYVGIPGFCSALPRDWLVELDEHRVELPGFHAHNGVEARKRALTQKRVARHREGAKEPLKRNSVTAGNAPALPDQDQDQDHKKKVPSEPLSSGLERGAVDRVFDHWKTVHGHPGAKLDDKRRKVIRAALATYSEEAVRESISGYKHSPHHQGDNDRGTVYDSIELLLRDAKHIDAGLRFYRDPPRTDLSSVTRRNVAAVADWVPPELRNAS